MPDVLQNQRLNGLLIRAYRSLLQYADECWPWTDADAASEQTAIRSLAAQQREIVGRMAALLDGRQQTVEFGVYPDWSELHYVSLDFLLRKLIADEEQLILAVERAQPALKSDPEASALAFDLLDSERRHVARLRETAAARKVAVPA